MIQYATRTHLIDDLQPGVALADLQTRLVSLPGEPQPGGDDLPLDPVLVLAPVDTGSITGGSVRLLQEGLEQQGIRLQGQFQIVLVLPLLLLLALSGFLFAENLLGLVLSGLELLLGTLDERLQDELDRGDGDLLGGDLVQTEGVPSETVLSEGSA